MEQHLVQVPVHNSRNTYFFFVKSSIVFKGLLCWMMIQLILPACRKKPDTPAAEKYVRFTSATATVSGLAGDQKTVTLESTGEWTITVPATAADWVTLDKTNGQGNTNIKVTATKDNNTGAKRTVVIIASLINAPGTAAAQLTIEQAAAPASNIVIQWKKMLGGNGNDYGFAVINTADGGHLLAGRTTSNNNGDVGAIKGGIDFWIVKLDNAGQIAWQKTFGGNADEVASSVAAAPDGGYVITGYTNSHNSGDVGANHGGVDYWVIKINANGVLQWQKTLGGSNDEFPNAVTITSEGAVVVAGYTKSNNSGDVGANKGNEDYWIVKLDHTNGNVGWKKILGGNGTEKAKAIIATNDGGVIVGGDASSNNNGDVPATKGAGDFWLVRLDKDGNITWKNAVGGSNIEELNGLALGANATVVAAGYTKSNNNGDVGASKGNEDYWIVQFNAATGALNWQKVLGGSSLDVARAVAVNPNGNIVVSGYTTSDNSGDVGDTQGTADYWIMQLSSAGAVNWKKLMGGAGDEHSFAVSAGAENSYVVAGTTWSNNSGDVGQNHGNGDFWIIKLKEQ